MSIEVARRHFTVAQFQRMGEAGIFSEDDRVELIEGEIIDMSPIGERHAACVKRLNRLLTRLCGDIALIGVQDPVQADEESQPQPDVAVLRFRDDYYVGQHPGADDTLVIIEVADSSVEYDRDVKGPLYARAGIEEFWLVDIPHDLIWVYTQPESTGYASSQRYGRGDTIKSPGLGSISVLVDHILP